MSGKAYDSVCCVIKGVCGGVLLQVIPCNPELCLHSWHKLKHSQCWHWTPTRVDSSPLLCMIFMDSVWHWLDVILASLNSTDYWSAPTFWLQALGIDGKMKALCKLDVSFYVIQWLNRLGCLSFDGQISQAASHCMVTVPQFHIWLTDVTAKHGLKHPTNIPNAQFKKDTNDPGFHYQLARSQVESWGGFLSWH